MRYLAVAAAMVASLCVYAFFAGLADQPPPVSKVIHRDCIQLTASPTTMACSDKRVYLLPGWVDIGPVTPVHGVPQR